MTSTPTPYVYPARLVRVVDGDTVDLMLDLGLHCYKQERVRLARVDTPEIFGRNAVPEGMTALHVTTDWLAAAAAQSPAAYPLLYSSERYDAREKYGRSLGTIWAHDGTSLNDHLISQGWAGTP